LLKQINDEIRSLDFQLDDMRHMGTDDDKEYEEICFQLHMLERIQEHLECIAEDY
jgi:hypothetical protein